MDSFYAGLPGTPFILKDKFKSIAEMESSFDNRTGYKATWFGEYCIIDTLSKHDPDNGKIFRRGYTQPEYCGQIVGPNGLSITKIEIVTKNHEDFNNLYDINSYQNFENNNRFEFEQINFPQWDEKTEQYVPASENSSVRQINIPSQYKKDFQYWVCTVVDDFFPQTNENKEIVLSKKEWTCFIAFYDILTDFSVSEQGTATTTWTSTKTKEETNKISWINEVTLNSNNGKFEIKGNNSKTNLISYLKWVKNIEIDSDTGEVKYTFTNNGAQTYEEEPSEDGYTEISNERFGWIKEIGIDEETGKLYYIGGGKLSEYETDESGELIKDENNNNIDIKQNLTTEPLNSVIAVFYQDIFETDEERKDKEELEIYECHAYIGYKYPIEENQSTKTINGIEAYWIDLGRISDGSKASMEINKAIKMEIIANTENIPAITYWG